VNILGLPIDDLKTLINKGFLNENNLQFGMWQHLPIINFDEISYDFNLDLLKEKLDSFHYDELTHHYDYIYKNKQ
jgi:hypothetical protein